MPTGNGNNSNVSEYLGRYERDGAMRLIALEVPVAVRVVASAALMALLVSVVLTFGVPNPNMILVTGLVACSVVFGIPGCLVSAAAMMGYTTYFFSTDHSLLSYTPENFTKVVVTLVGVVAIGILVCWLKGAEDRALRDVVTLADLLREDNALLQEASTSDALTGLRNRFALRRDYPAYAEQGRPVHVLMMDLDDFKGINDKHGHEVGDEVLREVGQTLLDVFGQTRSYRYGDEFLVIAADWTDTVFDAACDRLRERMEAIAVDGGEPVLFSGGYVAGAPHYQSDLRLMIRQADDSLYRAKRAGKDKILGGAFDRGVAERLEGDGRSVRAGDRA